MIIVTERLFEVPPGTDTYKAIQKYLSAHQDAESKWADFCKKYGSDQYYGGDDLMGLVFDQGKQPEGWINPSHYGTRRAFRPGLRNKVCAEAAREFKALPGKPNSLEWLDMLGIPIQVGSGRSFKTPGFKKIDGVYYLTATEGCGVPDDVREVPNSEAAKLQEIHEKEIAA